MQANETLRKSIVFLLYAALAIPFFVADSLLFPFIAGKGFAFRVIVEIALALWVVLAVRDERFRPNWKSPALVALGAFTLVTLLADVFGANRAVSLWSGYERMDGFVLIAHFAAYALILSSVFRTAADWRRYLVAWLVAAAGMAVFAASQIFGLQKINQGGIRVDGTFGNAVYLGGMMLLSVGFAATVAVTAREAWARNAAIVVGLASAVVLFYTGTRGSVLGLAAGVLVAGLLFLVVGQANTYRRIGWWVVGGLVVLSLLGVAAFQLDYFRTHPVFGRYATVSLEDKTTLSRFINAEIAWKGFLERPVLGWGQGNYSQVFDAHYDPRMHDQEQYFDHTHSILTDWLVAGGALGFLSYFALFFLVAWGIWRAEALSRGERVALIATMAGYLVHNMFVFDNLVSYMHYATLIGLAAALGPAAASRRVAMGSDARNLAAAVAVLALPAVIYFVNVPAIMAGKDIIRGIQITGVNPQTGQAYLVHGSVDRNREYFESAIARGTFGTVEAAQQFAAAAGSVATFGGIPEESRDAFLRSALAALESVVQASPRESRLRVLLGTYYARVGMLPEAARELEVAVSLAPQKQSVRVPLAAVYAAMGDSAKAIAFAEDTYRINEDNDASWVALVRLASRYGDAAAFDRLVNEAKEAGRYDRVVAYAESVVAANPGEGQNRAALARALTDAGRYAEAVAVLLDASKDFPNLKAQFDRMVAQILAASSSGAVAE